MDDKKTNHWRTYFILIIALAAVLRLLGIWHGYPFSYYGDEAHFVKRALSFGSGDLNPHWFHKPAFLMYILFFEYGLYFVFGKIVGLWNSVDGFAVSFITNSGPFYLIGRITIAIFSVASVAMVYLIGERHFKRGTGLSAAMILTLSFAHVVASQDIKADIPATFFTIISMYFLLNYTETNRLKFLWFATALAGMGVAMKFYPLVMLVPIIISIAIIQGKTFEQILQNWRNILLLSLSSVLLLYAVFFIFSPYSFIDPLGLKQNFGRIIGLVKDISGWFGDARPVGKADFFVKTMDPLTSTYYYFKLLLGATGMGPLIGSLSLAGLVLLLWGRKFKYLLILMFPLIFIAVSNITAPGYVEPRHQLPIYPFFAICAGYFIVKLTELFTPRTVIPILAISLLIPAYSIIENGLYLSKSDTRNLAKDWIETNIANGSKIVLAEKGPELLMSTEQLDAMVKLAEQVNQSDPNGQFTTHLGSYLKYQRMASEKSPSYYIGEIRFPWWREKEPEDGNFVLNDYDKDMGNPLRPMNVKSLDEYRQEGFEYYVVNSYRYGHYFQADSERSRSFPSFHRFYHDLFGQATLIKEFNPDVEKRPGPTIKIFHLPKI